MFNTPYSLSITWQEDALKRVDCEKQLYPVAYTKKKKRGGGGKSGISALCTLHTEQSPKFQNEINLKPHEN